MTAASSGDLSAAEERAFLCGVALAHRLDDERVPIVRVCRSERLMEML